MRADHKSHNYLYHSTVESNSHSSFQNSRNLQRSSLPIEQFLPNNLHQQRYQRQSNNIDSFASTNPFAQLRNQIGNLRSQFAKLKQSETSKTGIESYFSKKQQKTLNHSTILQSYDETKKTDSSSNILTSQNSKVFEVEKNRVKNQQQTEQWKNQKKYTFQTKKYIAQKEILIDEAGKISKLSSKIVQLEEQNKSIKCHNQNLQAQIQVLIKKLQQQKESKQQMSRFHKNELLKMMKRSEEKISELQEIHRLNFRQILGKLDQSEQARRQIQIKLIEVESQYGNQQTQLIEKDIEIQGKNQDLKKILSEKAELNTKLQAYMKQKQSKIQDEPNSKLSTLSKQNMRLTQQIHFLSSQIHLKQGFIENLCRDIGRQAHNVQLLKMDLSSNLKYIEELNQIIIRLEYQKLNRKYGI